MSHALARHAATVTEWWKGFSAAGSGRERVAKHVQSAGHVVRSGGESVLVGAGLGLLEQKLGSLDHQIGGHSVPVDAVIGVAGLLGAVAMARDEVGTDLRNVGTVALGVFSYRKGKEWAEKRASGGGDDSGKKGGTQKTVAAHGDIGTVGYHGEPGEEVAFGSYGADADPIDVAAMKLGRTAV